MRIRSLALLTVVASLAVACSGAGGPGSTPALRVVVLQDGSVPDARDLVSPAVLALQLALSRAPSVELEVLDTGGDAARTLAAAGEVGTDPSVVGAVVAPFTPMPAEALESMLTAGVPVLSLSSIDEPPSGVSTPSWRRFVPPISVSARAIVRVAENLQPGAPVCVVGEDTAWSELLRAAIDRSPADVRRRSITSSPSEAGGAIEAQGCGAAIWTGTAPGADALRRSLGEGVALVLDDAARTDGFLTGRWPDAPRALAVCPCVDVSTSAGPDAQAFVHDYQESTGLDAGPFAVEGFDAGTWIVRAIQAGPTRPQVADRLASATRFTGLVRTYRWDGGAAVAAVGVYRAVGLRWLVAPGLQRALRRAGSGR
jgi:branched-chain amino acid transport system substrate-binding protein